MTDEEIIQEARNRYALGSSNNIEIDAEPPLSHADDGCWVAAWVWVPYEEDEEDGEN